MWIKDPKTKEKSVTVTLLICGYTVALSKLLFAGFTFGDYSFGQFSGTDFAAVVGALGTIYGFRKFTDKDK